MIFKTMFANRITRALSALTVAAGIYMVQPYRPVVFVGSSMSPTYQNREMALATTNKSNLKKGQVVVIDTPSGPIIKRIAFMPGDSFERFYYNGEWHDVLDNIPAGPRTRQRMKFRRTFVPEGYVYVLGDNPTVSIDSRQLGMLPMSSIKYVLTNSKPQAVSTVY